MLNLAGGIRTLRDWSAVQWETVKNVDRIDRSVLLADLSQQHGSTTQLLPILEREGVAVVPDYWTAEKCAAARAEIDRVMEANPAAVQKNSCGSDRRLFGVEAGSELLAEFHRDPFPRSVGELLHGFELYNFATLGARIDATKENNGSGDGWHRDGHGFQYKSILYLSDVDDGNGPFEYLPGSHRLWRTAVDTVVRGLPPAPATRYTPEMIDRIVEGSGLKINRYTGTAGTLILADTTGIHRGRPLRSGARYALTNYFYHPHQINEARIQNFPPMVPGATDRVRAFCSDPDSTETHAATTVGASAAGNSRPVHGRSLGPRCFSSQSE